MKLSTATRALLGSFALFLTVLSTATGADDAASWRAVAAGDAVVLLRHALAPGTGDPEAFDVDDCATQRNLSTAGRAQARAIGHALAARIEGDRIDVYSSAWCRCLDTGRLLDFGTVEPLASLNSFFRDRDSATAQTAALLDWIDARLALKTAPPAILVTHQVNVTAATGVYPASGEAVVIGAGEEVLLSRNLANED